MEQLTTINGRLERLQKFKRPLSEIMDSEIYGITNIYDDNSEFYLLNNSKEYYEESEIGEQLTATFEKLARLLELKEDLLKGKLKEFLKYEK